MVNPVTQSHPQHLLMANIGIKKISRSLRRVVIGSSALVLSACAVTQVEAPSQVVVPPEFEQVSAQSQQAAQVAEANLRQWWRAWQDPVLNQLIEAGMQGNLDLQIAQSRLAEAQATSALARADLAPQAGLSAGAGLHALVIDNPIGSAERERASMMGLDLGGDTVNAHGNNAYLGFSASWEPDIFGAKRSDADAAQAAALAEQERVYGAQLMLTSQIADHYLQLRSVEQRMRIYDANIRSLKELSRYTQGRFKAGHVGADVVAQAAAGLNGLLAQRASLQAQRDAHERSIAVLVGQVPQAYKVPASTSPILYRLPAAPSGQTPGSVLERRPDVRAKALAVQARAAQVASAKADLLPRFEINFLGNLGRIEMNASAPEITSAASILSVGMSLPIFTAGRIQRNIEASDARLKTAALEYDQSILQALSEVDSVYQLHYGLGRQNAALSQALKQKRVQADGAQKLFQHGHKTLDEVLRARLETYDLEDKQLQGLLAQGQNLLNLYKVLGGGWTAN